MRQATMCKFLLVTVLLVVGASAVSAQGVPHDFKQDTPPVPGQIVEQRRDQLRMVPLPLRQTRDAHEIALPSSGPKGVVRETRNEPEYTPSAEH